MTFLGAGGQNIFTDPQKPMKVTPGIYPINGADENSPCCLTVDFALTYFLVSGEIERSKMPVNLLSSSSTPRPAGTSPAGRPRWCPR